MDPGGSIKVNDHFIMSIRNLVLETFIINTLYFFLSATAVDHIPSTAAFGSAAYNGKESPKQQLAKNNLSALTRPSVLGICMDLFFNNLKDLYSMDLTETLNKRYHDHNSLYEQELHFPSKSLVTVTPPFLLNVNFQNKSLYDFSHGFFVIPIIN